MPESKTEIPEYGGDHPTILATPNHPSPPPPDVRRSLPVFLPEPEASRSCLDSRRVALFGHTLVRKPATDDSPAWEDHAWWVSPWVKALLMALVLALLALAAHLPFRWIGRLLALIWTIVANLFS